MAFGHDPAATGGLTADIAAWTRGDPPPKRLLHFPTGPELVPTCGMRAFGSDFGDFIGRIDNDLLAALLFGPQADEACVRAAGRRLVDRRGVRHARTVFADQRRTRPGIIPAGEQATLVQLLASPYARVRAASLLKAVVPAAQAEAVLAKLKADLAAGVPWARAYGTASDAVPAGGPQTHLCYEFDG